MRVGQFELINEPPALDERAWQARAGSVIQLFDEQVAICPDAAALRGPTQTVTYRELQARSLRVAHGLSRACRLDPEARVGLCLPPSLELIVAIWGVLRSGAAYVPLDHKAPAARNARVLREANASCVIGAHPSGDVREIPAFDVDELSGLGDPPLSGVPKEPATSQLAYVIFTSGSTGAPKGVAIEHGSLSNYVQWAAAHYFGGGGGEMPLIGSVAFDMSVTCLFVPLLRGQALHVLEDRPIDELLADCLSERRAIDAIKLTPSHLQLLKPAALAASSLTTVILGGEALRDEQVARLHELKPGLRVFNEYGPTEATVGCTVAEVERDVHIGRPAAGAEILVLDRQRRLQPPGAIGEIYVGGPGLSRGYLDQPDLTATSFVPHPLRGGARLYKTGDLGRVREDGELEYLGRCDDQLKLRGFRVEPGEVEAALAAIPGVSACAVVPRATPDGELELVAFYTGDELDERALGARLSAELPVYMVPRRFSHLAELPLAPSGKLDRSALPNLPWLQRPRGELARSPRDLFESTLAELWAELLGVAEPSVDDDFFALGGHSLVAARLAERVERQLGKAMTIADVFEAPTIRRLSERLRQGATQKLSITPAPPGQRGKLSFAQHRLWVLDQLGAGAAYSVPAAFELVGAVDVSALRSALRALCDRHELLRARFADDDGEAYRLVDDAEETSLDVVSLLGAHADVVRDWLIDEAQRPFDLRRERPYRAHLVQLESERWVLFVNLHHIVCDEESARILLAELGELYRAERRGAAASLSPLSLGYGDFAFWQRTRAAEHDMCAAFEHFRAQLTPPPPRLELPRDRARGASKRYAGASAVDAWPSRLSSGLRALATANGTSLFTALLAVTKLLLARYTGQTDVTVGVPTTERTHAELEGQVGLYLNTLVFRTDLRLDEGFTPLVRALGQQAARAYRHASYPFDRLVDELALPRDASRQPLFDVMVAYEHDQPRGLSLDGLEVRELDIGSQVSKFDLLIRFEHRPDALGVRVEYDTDLFDPQRVARLLGHLRYLAEQVVAAPDLPLAAHELATPEERTELLALGHGSTVELEVASVVESFDQRANSTPGATALAGERSISYAELRGRSERLASELTELGLRIGEPVAVMLPRSEHVVTAWLGVLRAGGVYLYVDPGLPPERRERLLAKSAVRFAVVDGGVEAKLLARRLRAQDGASALHDEVRHPGGAPPALALDRPAYLIYTSGSTGEPKGVLGTHRCLANLTAWHVRKTQTSTPPRVLQGASLGFDVSLQEFAFTLASGGTLFFPPDSLRTDPRALARYIAQHRIQLWIATFSLIRLLCEELESFELLSSLEHLVSTGEALELTPPLRQLLAAQPGLKLHNFYGPTETHVITSYTLPEDAERWDQLPPIGRPIDNSWVALVDGAGKLVPPGIPGELILGGANVASGYFGRDDLTAQRFAADSSDFPGRYYRSGDICQWEASGELRFLGRRDDQHKIRGFRVELAEVEAELSKLPGVRAAASVVRKRADGERELHGYVQVDPDVDLEELLRLLRLSTSSQLVPDRLMRLDALPVTSSGKLDRSALPKPERDTRPAASPTEARTPVERQIVRLFRELLGDETLGVDSDFFSSGGQSIAAMRLANRLRQQFAVELSLPALFSNTTPAAQARLIEASSPARFGSIAKAKVGSEAPLTPAQLRLWALERLEAVGAAHTLSICYELRGPLDRPRLKQALRALFERHESLRTTISTRDGSPERRVLDGSAMPIEELAAPAAAGDLPEEWLEARSQPLRLDGSPLSHAAIVQLSSERHWLRLAAHHIVCDGGSFATIARDLAELYAPSGGERPPLRIQYADYARWHESYLAGSEAEQDRRYWLAQLAELPAPLELPTDRPRPARRSFEGKTHRARFDEELVVGLERLGRAHGASLFAVLAALVNVICHRYSAARDIALGVAVSNRDHADLEGQVGLFVNTVVLRTKLEPSQTFAEVLSRVGRNVLAAVAHGRYPFERVVAELAPQRDLTRSPLFDVLLTLQDHDEPLQLHGLDATVLPQENRAAKLDLTFNWARQRGNGLECAVEYSVELFDADRVTAMLAHLAQAARSALCNPDCRVGRLALLDDAAQARLLELSRGAATEYPSHVGITTLFEQRAAAHPSRIAIVAGDARVSYAELNDRMLRIATALSSRHGVARGAVVGVYGARSVELVAALLGVLRAGAAYLPLDPAQPIERLRYLVQDAGAELVLCSEPEPEPDFPGAQVVQVRACLDALDAQPPAPPLGRDLAYVIYTSGTTGRPKGVEIEHHSVVNRLLWMQRAFPLQASDVILQKTSIGFDVSVWELFWWSLFGASLCLLPPGDERSPRAIAACVERHGVTVLHFVPTLLDAFFQQVRGPGSLGSVRRVFASGEALSARLVHDFHRIFPREAELVNLYGPTEATVDVTYHACRRDHTGAVPIGKPIDNTEILIVSEELERQPLGIVGELCIAGVGVARGYRHRPDLTAQAFVPHPERPKERMYRTGDYGRQLSDGSLLYLGRRDRQVKIHGHRVELREIERCVEQFPAVATSRVVLREAGGAVVPVAYVVARGRLDLNALRAWVESQLPLPVVPRHFVELERMPVNPSGKLDESSLPAPIAPPGGTVQADLAHDAHQHERALAATFSEVLGRPAGPDDNFFALGGDSIRAIQVVARLSAKGLTLRERDIFSHPTLRALAAQVSVAAQSPASEPPAQGPVPLTPIQRWLWEAKGDTIHHFNQALMVRAKARVRVDALGTALDALLQQHDALRLSFHVNEGELRQAYARAASAVSLQLVDLRGVGDVERILALRCEEAQGPFALDHAPLLRCVCFRMDDADRVLLVCHHLIVDVVSLRILAEDLEQAYLAALGGTSPSFAPATASYQRFAQWLELRAASPELRAEHAFWQLQSARGDELDVDHPSALGLVGSTRSETLRLGTKATDALLRAANHAYGTRAHELLLAAVARAIRSWTGQSYVRVDVEGHGRALPEGAPDVSRTLGWFTCIYPLVLLDREGDELGANIEAVKKRVRAVPHGGLGYGLWRGATGGPGSADNSLILFNYLGQIEAPAGGSLCGELEPLRSALEAAHARRSHELELQAFVHREQLELSIKYSSHRFEPERIRRLARACEAALQELVDHCSPQESIECAAGAFPRSGLDRSELRALLDGE